MPDPVRDPSTGSYRFIRDFSTATKTDLILGTLDDVARVIGRVLTGERVLAVVGPFDEEAFGGSALSSTTVT